MVYHTGVQDHAAALVEGLDLDWDWKYVRRTHFVHEHFSQLLQLFQLGPRGSIDYRTDSIGNTSFRFCPSICQR